MNSTDNLPARPLRVAAVMLQSAFGELDRNLESILGWVEKAGDQGADLVCFPELALQGYISVPTAIHEMAQPADGRIGRRLQQAAAQYCTTISLGMALRDGERVYNAQAFFGPQGFLGAQHKVHLCGCDRAYDPGHKWNLFCVQSWNVGATICFDSEFPEAARILALQGAHLIVMSFATGRRNSLNQPARPEDWVHELMTWAPARAYDNRIFVLGVNQAGDVSDPLGLAVANPDGRPGVEEWSPKGATHHWPGYGFAINPRGLLCGEADRSGNDEKLLLVDVDPQILRDARAPVSVKWPDREVTGAFLDVRRCDTFARILGSFHSAPGSD